MAFDLSILAGLGAGANALGEGLTTRSLRQMQEAEKKAALQRQLEQDALGKAAMRSNELHTLESMNYTPDPQMSAGSGAVNASLNKLALGGPQDTFTSSIDNTRYSRQQSDRPFAIKTELEDAKRDAATTRAMAAIQQRADAAAASDLTKNNLWKTPSANNTDNNDTKLLIAELARQGAKDRAATAQSNRPSRIPTSVQNELRGGLDILDALGAADTSMATPEAKNAFGFKNAALSAVVPDALEGWAKNKFSKEGTVVRQDIARVKSAVQLLRSGKAVTPSEMRTLRPYLPDESDTPEVIMQKLPGMRREFTNIVKRRIALYGNDPMAPQYQDELDALERRSGQGAPSAMQQLLMRSKP